MALTKDYEYEIKGSLTIQDFVIGAADVLYKGAIVNIGTDGKLKVAADVADERPAGLMKEQVDYDGSTTKRGEVINGRIWIPYAGAAQSDVGLKFFATADDTIATSAINVTEPLGICLDWKAGYLLIDTVVKTITIIQTP
jgi:hypothetical protein